MLNYKNLTKIATDAIETEIEGLKSLVEFSIDEKFFKLVDLIMAMTNGKVILSGIGKPGNIAHKMASTLASTGTPALFIHPSEASHGDLGMIAKHDLVILLSNSGGSTELNDIIAYCKRNNITLISITRNADSFLAKSSDLPIVLKNIRETNSVNSPTTSMVMMLSYLDALATVLIETKSFNSENYKMFHPGGKLGVALININEIMRTENIPLINDDVTMDVALDEMINKNLGCVGIIEKQSKKLVGIITDGDLKRHLKEQESLLHRPVSDVMTKNPKVIHCNSLAVEAVSKMYNGTKYVQVLFVVDDEEKVVGIVHIQDLFKARIV